MKSSGKAGQGLKMCLNFFNQLAYAIVDCYEGWLGSLLPTGNKLLVFEGVGPRNEF